MKVIEEKANGEWVAIDFIAGYKEAQKWIDVKDELPEMNIPVLVKSIHVGAETFDIVRRIEVLEKNMSTPWQWSSVDFRTYYAPKVTHWKNI